MLTALVVCSCHATPDFTEARSVMAQYRAEQAAAAAAQGKQDAAVAQQHQTKANDSLKRARALYEQTGAAAAHDARTLREYAETLAVTGDYDLASET
ncbi:MAG: hypothetical protein NTU83_10330, partial [Candidatus Hydrogenedentes bacterium]|nr:hypothetical protein [Candidatus Hydrogenedentota bacterium]